jgi:hypothetical protein
VPFRVHQYADEGDEPELDGTLVLVRVNDEWELVAVEERLAGEEVPSEGGDLPSRAPVGAWIGAIALGVVLSLGGSALIELAGRHRQEPAPAS